MRGSRVNSKIVTDSIRRSGWKKSILWKPKTNEPVVSGGRSKSRLGAVEVPPKRNWPRPTATRMCFPKTSRPLPDHLPREEVIHELTDEERTCPCCGKLRKEIGSEVSEQLEFVPASLKVIQHHRKKYACDACEENVAIASKPAQPIDKGLPGPGLLAHTVLSKYGDYLPLYRQEDILSRHGIIIRRSTLCDCVAATADLLKPLYDLMGDRVRASHVIHTDDTGIKMLDVGQCRNCKFWGYAGDKDNPYAVYEFSLTREGSEPSRFLEGFNGYLQADAFSGYDQVYASGEVIEVACMAHARRYWWESIETDFRRAHEAISYIARLYALEAQFDEAKLDGDARRDARLPDSSTPPRS